MQINPVTRTVSRLRAAALCRKSPSTMPPLRRTKKRSRKQTNRYNGNSRSRPSTNTAATVLARPLRPEPLKGQRRREPTEFTRQAADDGVAVDAGLCLRGQRRQRKRKPCVPAAGATRGVKFPVTLEVQVTLHTGDREKVSDLWALATVRERG